MAAIHHLCASYLCKSGIPEARVAQCVPSIGKLGTDVLVPSRNAGRVCTRVAMQDSLPDVDDDASMRQSYPPGMVRYESMVVLRPDMTEEERIALTQRYEEVRRVGQHRCFSPFEHTRLFACLCYEEDARALH